jgi:hypothetical protein
MISDDNQLHTCGRRDVATCKADHSMIRTKSQEKNLKMFSIVYEGKKSRDYHQKS